MAIGLCSGVTETRACGTSSFLQFHNPAPMLDQQTWLYLVGILGLITAKYWLAPYLHWKNSKKRALAKQEFWLAGDSKPVPANARSHFDATAARLASEGFKPLT